MHPTSSTPRAEEHHAKERYDSLKSVHDDLPQRGFHADLPLGSLDDLGGSEAMLLVEHRVPNRKIHCHIR